MENKLNIQKLLLSIKESIKNIMIGSTSFDEARENYKDLYNILMDLEGNKIPINENVIKGILYYHNIMNFSKITALGTSDGEKITLTASSGTGSQIDHFKNQLLKLLNYENDFENKVYVINSDKDSNLNCYLYKKIANNQIYFIATITSNIYFNEEKFSIFCSLLGQIIDYLLNSSKSKSIVYNNKSIEDIKSYCQAQLNKNSLYVDIYTVQNLKSIYSPLDVFHLSKFIQMVIDLLKIHSDQNSNVIPFNISHFLVFYNEGSKLQFDHKNSLNIIYNDINIPYLKKTLHVTNMNLIKKLIWELQIDEN